MKNNPQKLGKAGEDAALIFMQSIGCKMIEKISTPAINVKGKFTYSKKSSVDFIAAVPSKYIPKQYLPSRIEVKLCDGPSLNHSVLDEHQVKSLNDWRGCGFESFIIWVNRARVFMFDYPTIFFQHGKSIDSKTAEDISIYRN